MKLSALLGPLLDAKADHELIRKQIIAYEMEQKDALEKRRAAARERIRCYRKRRNLVDWVQLTGLVYERDGYVCAYCGDIDGPHQIDHVMPLAKGGTNDIDNLAVACKVCASKRDLTIDEWKGFQ